VNEKGQIRFGLGAIKGMGEGLLKLFIWKDKTEDLKIFMIF
jgi:DNA polymerase III alpha subunit